MKEMFDLAVKAQKNSYSPYSQFRVGACIRTTTDKFFTGCNVENAVYGLTNCAERSAIFSMINAGEREIAEILIVGSSNQPCYPCGACRQCIREFSNKNTLIHSCNQEGIRETKTIMELLPDAFGPEFLETEPS